MGLLVDGKWVDKWYDTKASGGKFIRQDAGFRNWITPDGSAGVSGKSGFKAESGGTIYMFHWHAHGHTEHLYFESLRVCRIT